jgi:hypothetical protein
MNDTQTAQTMPAASLGDNFVTSVAHDLDNPLPARPAIPLREEEVRKHVEERAAEERRQNRQLALRQLKIESLVARVFHERIRQVRGDVEPDIGTRDMHIKATIVRTLMSITADNADLSVEEFEQLAL